MKNTLFLLLLTTLLTLNASAQTGVYVNGRQLTYQQVNALSQYYQVKIAQGRYWYDQTCGLWGYEGAAASGVMHANLDFGAPMRSNASAGRTGVFLNGRQLNHQELRYWQQFTGYIQPGRYWLDANGYAGPEGGYATINLAQAAAQQQRASGGSNNFWRSNTTGVGTGGNGKDFYVIGKGWSW